MKSRTKEIESKVCRCGRKYFRRKGKGSDKQWDKRRYCSHPCAVKYFYSERQNKLWADKKYRNHMVSVHIGKIGWSRGKKLPERSGVNSPSWKGEDTQYGPKHSWVARNKTRPKNCEHCGMAGKTEWANIDHKYKRNLNDYMALCRSCHRQYDKKLK